MPRGDGTGPNGVGPTTGRGAGYCAGVSMPGFMNSRMGMGLGRGFNSRRSMRNCGFSGVFAGFGFRNNSNINYEVNQKEVLKNQANFLENQLQQINKQLQKMENVDE